MKIMGGSLKGRNFFMPADIRPTSNLVRKAVFDVLGDISGLSFLELYAGSGAMAWEAISRGATRVSLVEGEPLCQKVIEQNRQTLGLQHTGSGPDVSLLGGDVFMMVKELHRRKKTYDIVFADPPFHLDLGKKTLKHLGAHDILRPFCFIFIQSDRREILPEVESRFVLIRKKRYGTSILRLYQGRDESSVLKPSEMSGGENSDLSRQL